MRPVASPRERHQLDDLLRRDHTLYGGMLFGIDGHVIEIQARAMRALAKSEQGSWGSTQISGMARGAISEAMSRIQGAFAKLSVPAPRVEVLINLAPADLPKEGTHLDLPLAIILLQAAGMLPDLPDTTEGQYVLMGELGLHAEVRRVPGALSLAYNTKPGQKLIVPSGNEKECVLILAKPGHDGCGVFPVKKLEDVIGFFQGVTKLENALKSPIKFESAIPKAVDFGLIRGQQRAKRAAVISAAGGHNLLLIGPPGEGKSLLASAIPGILPRLPDHEKVELTRIYSACGALDQDGLAVTRRPMRSVHHSASLQSVVGGGSNVPRPGEITLAHLGVLFLDEVAEFSRSTLEALRQPIESGEVHLSRVKASLTFPCRFTLVAAMNPCPCGYYGTDRCRCTPQQVKKYQEKISGPILDRIDLQVEIDRLSVDDRFAPVEEGVSAKLRDIVERARRRQQKRFEGLGVPHNAAIPGGRVGEFCNFSDDGFADFKRVIGGSDLSTRSMDRLAKVARTIADLDESDRIEPPHVDEAAGFVVGGMLREAF